MAFFDEPRPSRGARIGRQLGARLRRQPASLLSLWLLLTMTSVVAFAASIAALEARDRIGDAASRTEISLFLRPDAPRSDAETLVAEVGARPDVRSARLVAKDDALAALDAAALVMPTVGANPLPDAVVVALRWDARASAPSARLEAASKSLGAMAGVASADYDRRWAAELDRWSSVAERIDRVLQPVAAAAAALAALLAALLWTRAGRTTAVTASASDAPADALAAGVVALMAAVSSAAVGWFAVDAIVTTVHRSVGALQPLAGSGGPMPASSTWWIAAALVAATTLGAALGAVRTDRSPQ